MARSSISTCNISFTQQMACLLLLIVTLTSAFVVPAPRANALTTASCASPIHSAFTRYHRRAASATLRMAEEEVAEAAEETVAEVQAADTAQSVRSFFAPNENIRLGSSRDQDGKSNVWAVEPKMRVEGTDVETPESQNLVVAAGVLGAVVAGMAVIISSLPAPDSI